MRLFQNAGIYPAYLRRLNRVAAKAETHSARKNAFLSDRFGAPHFLKPVLDHDASAFFTNGDDAKLQRLWARENGLAAKMSLEDILLAQIEAHRTEVFYNIDPTRYSPRFLKRLPGSVRRKIAWRAAPSPATDLGAYDLVVCNFTGILANYRRLGWKSAWFAPAHDPVMDTFASNCDRPIDVLFVGSYTRHHLRRAELLEAVASLSERYTIAMHLDRSGLTRLAEALPSGLALLSGHRRPAVIRAVSRPPVFGIDMYGALSQAKIVLNGAVDMAGDDRGNMRCFESMGCGCALLSDAGNYPQGMETDVTMASYTNPDDAVARVDALLIDPLRTRAMAAAGYRMISEQYSKQRQWHCFVELAQ